MASRGLPLGLPLCPLFTVVVVLVFAPISLPLDTAAGEMISISLETEGERLRARFFVAKLQSAVGFLSLDVVLVAAATG